MSTKPSSTKQPPLMPDGKFFWGHISDFTGDTLDFIVKARDIADLVRTRFGPYTLYIASHPDYFRQVLVTDAKNYDKTFVTKRVLSDSAGNGLFTNDGEPWKRQRKLVQPAFHTQRISAYADVMVAYANRRASQWKLSESFDIEREMMSLTMEIVGKTLFDVDISEDTGELEEVITHIFERVNYRFDHLIVPPRWLPTPGNRQMRDAISKLDTAIQSFIDEWRKTGEDKGDLLSMLLMAQGDDGVGMSDKQIHDEAVTLFVAGHETTANTLTWVWYLLSQYPEVTAKLQTELAEVLGGRNPTFEDLPQLTYTEMIVKETMRLYPAAWAISRDTNTDVVLGEYPIKKGQPILLNVFGVHRDPRFFDDPEHFDPERFSPENEKLIEKYAYLPFGAGPRVCVGNSFAMMEAKLIIATLAQKFHFVHDPAHIVEPVRVFTLRTKHGMHMKAQARKSEYTLS